ncbi:hypothetical protein NFI96_001108 [Prochilodus magdalenae]|nr:hypothetical protein NFI96_001108 [Prochilodus magdalenae]
MAIPAGTEKKSTPVSGQGTLTNIPSANRGQRQALNTDYEGSGYDKGHLFPVFHTHTENIMLATSTLTNAAPQDPTFNRGQWRIFEENVAGLLQQDCSRSYIVTGVVPGNKQIGNGVRVADYYWSAFCCYMKSGGMRSEGYLGPDNNGLVQTYTVSNLETTLSNYYGTRFSIFQGTC